MKTKSWDIRQNGQVHKVLSQESGTLPIILTTFDECDFEIVLSNIFDQKLFVDSFLPENVSI